ncbi:ABC transporter substrate-binding protein [Glaciimonas sp. CA11.2]|uniref:ABC transporter substrate-binding protein n=1 Tax=unclassified Glaciimonas TaxID=2644401 RepID=UPI002AB4BB6A|nr:MULTISPECIES: ABC transporter substrate-binding protein [unclassified Glaciimonas]MDY7546033.1 ABC transporter substrate-binding protein [Glaciimonas sp. CA11.2]MEB0012117.1 ABC transporter substrate-binding protein [Glaciimonas sp. Cout2]MEB0083873.1 ABC transporter substrate-binding protein [Glaciimonas sp. Gout2]MEB0162061.1 ABC transporter substrate-binding protein [Glaciimonas sp. CA11.2]
MLTPKKSLTLLVTAISLAATGSVLAQTPAGYPADYNKIIEAAKKEGKVVIYSATDSKAAEPLIKDFSALYPGIKVEYNDMNSTEVYNRFISEAAAGGTTADLLWSSSMDLQVKLVSEGYGAVYKSPEVGAIPAWANYKDTAYGTTYEPIAIVYNKRLVPADEVPTSHAAFTKLLTTKADKYRNKVTTYDIEKSGVGFSFITQDAQDNPKFWELATALGDVAVRVQSSTGTMLERISSGENLIGYNMLGSYALSRAKKDPSLGVAFTTDYNLVMSRVAFINKSAKNSNAAKLWLDYLLSKRGQTIVANEAQLFAIRSDVTGPSTMSELTKQLGTALKPIPVSPALLQYLDQTKRLAFLKQWKAAAGKK